MTFQFQADYDALSEQCPPKDYEPKNMGVVYRWTFETIDDNRNFQSQYHKNPKQVQCLVTAVEDLPESYLPTENSFYKKGKYTELAETFKNTVIRSSIYDVLNHLISEVETIKNEQKRNFFDFSNFE